MKALVLGMMACAVALPATADELRLPPNPAYQAECGSCHVPYPPRLLPESSWRRLMGGLERHFGGDASLDPRTHQEIGAYLAQHAGRRAPPAGAEPRITETRWFVKEHDELPAMKNPADCAACHTQAQNGDYSKRTRKP
jgi:hypothetical protein